MSRQGHGGQWSSHGKARARSSHWREFALILKLGEGGQKTKNGGENLKCNSDFIDNLHFFL